MLLRPKGKMALPFFLPLSLLAVRASRRSGDRTLRERRCTSRAPCQEQNITPVFFYSPMEAEVSILNEKKSNHINDMIVNYCLSNDVPLISPLNYFRNNLTKELYIDGGHYTKHGNQLCGQYIAKQLMSYLPKQNIPIIN